MSGDKDTIAHNRDTWNRESRDGGPWSIPVTADEIARARRGDWRIILTPNTPVPAGWFPGELAGLQLLALAGSGGQQAPILAAAGASVTVLDFSEEQLKRDRHVAERDGLRLTLEQGDMRDLSRFADASFDLVINPCSVVFVPDVRPVWREVARVLRPGGRFMTGLCNPALYMFADTRLGEDGLTLRYPLPVMGDTGEARDHALKLGEPFQFSHTLTDLIAGQLEAGLQIVDFFEDHWNDPALPLDRFFPPFFATLAIKR